MEGLKWGFEPKKFGFLNFFRIFFHFFRIRAKVFEPSADKALRAKKSVIVALRAWHGGTSREQGPVESPALRAMRAMRAPLIRGD